ncbi:MAG: hypothetical protein MHPSP_002885 [Paramarteilia canceri]
MALTNVKTHLEMLKKFTGSEITLPTNPVKITTENCDNYSHFAIFNGIKHCQLPGFKLPGNLPDEPDLFTLKFCETFAIRNRKESLSHPTPRNRENSIETNYPIIKNKRSKYDDECEAQKQNMRLIEMPFLSSFDKEKDKSYNENNVTSSLNSMADHAYKNFSTKDNSSLANLIYEMRSDIMQRIGAQVDSFCFNLLSKLSRSSNYVQGINRSYRHSSLMNGINDDEEEENSLRNGHKSYH